MVFVRRSGEATGLLVLLCGEGETLSDLEAENAAAAERLTSHWS